MSRVLPTRVTDYARAWRCLVGCALVVGWSEHAATQVMVQLYVEPELAPDAAALHVRVLNDEQTVVL